MGAFSLMTQKSKLTLCWMPQPCIGLRLHRLNRGRRIGGWNTLKKQTIANTRFRET
jgi:hypothetical protein